MKFDSAFWFIQPSSILSKSDQYFGYLFVGFLLVSLALAVAKLWIAHSVRYKLINKFFYLFLIIGFSGLVWYGARYENVPIFAMHYWAGLVLLVGLIWLLFVLKYLVFNFFGEVKEYNHELIKRKYLPKA